MKNQNYLLLDKEKQELVDKLKSKKNATVLTINNFKGGVGKSTLINLFAYIMEKNQIKTLLIDSDPQRTLTKKILKNYDIQEKAEKSFMQGIQSHNLKKSITHLTPYLSIIEGDWELSTFDRYARQNLTLEAEYFLYKYLIEDLKNDYDFIIFDSVPTTSVFTHNCIVASDLVLAPTQAEDESFDNTLSYMNYLQSMTNYNPNLDIVGVVPYLSELDNSTNVKYLKKYQETFHNLTFTNIIKRSARVMSWGTDGITENKGYDKQILTMYLKVFIEFLERIEKGENNGE